MSCFGRSCDHPNKPIEISLYFINTRTVFKPCHSFCCRQLHLHYSLQFFSNCWIHDLIHRKGLLVSQRIKRPKQWTMLSFVPRIFSDTVHSWGGGGNKVGLNILSVSKKSKTNLSKVIAESIFYSYFAKYKEKEIWPTSVLPSINYCSHIGSKVLQSELPFCA